MQYVVDFRSSLCHGGIRWRRKSTSRGLKTGGVRRALGNRSPPFFWGIMEQTENTAPDGISRPTDLLCADDIQKIGGAVLWQAVLDACYLGVSTITGRDTLTLAKEAADEARDWLLNDDVWFPFYCACIGYDPMYFREWVHKLRDRGWYLDVDGTIGGVGGGGLRRTRTLTAKDVADYYWG